MAWIRCESCEDFLCTQHDTHVAECNCPPIDCWAERKLDPYGGDDFPEDQIDDAWASVE